MIVPRVWNRQPTVPSKIAASALTEGMHFCAYPLGGSYVDVVTGNVSQEAYPGTAPTTPGRVLTQRFKTSAVTTCRPGEWIHAPQTSANQSGHKFAQRTQLDNYTGPITLMCLGGYTGYPGGSAHTFFGTSGSGSVSNCQVGIDDGTSTGSNWGCVGVGFLHAYDASAVSSTGALGQSGETTDRLHFFGCGADGAGSGGGSTVQMYAYYSGLGFTRETLSGLSFWTNASDRITYIGTNSAGWNNYNHVIGLCMAWQRVLSLQEYIALWMNPWQVFQQEPRRTYVMSIAAVAAPNLLGRAVL